MEDDNKNKVVLHLRHIHMIEVNRYYSSAIEDNRLLPRKIVHLEIR